MYEEHCSVSFSTGDNKEVIISIDGTALSAETTRGVLSRSKVLSELLAGTEESAISLLLEASVHLDLREAKCTLPVLPGAVRAWTDFGSGEHQSLDALADVVQVSDFLGDDDALEQSTRAVAQAIRYKLRAGCASSFIEALQNLPFCTGKPAPFSTTTSSENRFISPHIIDSDDEPHPTVAATQTSRKGRMDKDGVVRMPCTPTSSPRWHSPHACSGSPSSPRFTHCSLLERMHEPAAAPILQQLSLAEAATLTQPLLKAALLARCSSGQLTLSQHALLKSPVHGDSQQCACPLNRSELVQACMPLLPDVSPASLDLSHSFWAYHEDTEDMSYVLSQLSSLTKLNISNPELSMLHAAQLATAATGLQRLVMRDLKLQLSTCEGSCNGAHPSTRHCNSATLVDRFQFSSPIWSILGTLDMQGCSMKRSDYCQLLQQLPVLSSLTSLDLSDLELFPKSTQLAPVKPPSKRRSAGIHRSLQGNSRSIDNVTSEHCIVEDWVACAAVLHRLGLHGFSHLGITIEPSADRFCRALASALRDGASRVPSRSVSISETGSSASSFLEGQEVTGSSNSCGECMLASLAVTNTVDLDRWAQDNGSQISQRSATALFTALAAVPSLQSLRLVGMPIGCSPILSSSYNSSSEEIGLEGVVRSSTRPRVSRELLSDADLYAKMAALAKLTDLAAEDRLRKSVDAPGFLLPLQCLEVRGLDFGVRVLDYTRGAAYQCNGDKMATYPWSSLRGLTRLALTSVKLLSRGHAARMSRGLRSLSALRSLCITRHSGVGGVFHDPANESMFLSAVGSLTALTELELAGSDPHVSRLLDEDVGEADQGAPDAPAAAQGTPALPARGLEHITSLTSLKKLSLQGSCCWRILFSGRVHSLMALTSVTQLAIDMHAPDAYRTVRAPRCRGGCFKALEAFWRPVVVTIGSMTQLKDLRLGIYTTYSRCMELKDLTALTSLDLTVHCSADFQQPSGRAPHASTEPPNGLTRASSANAARYRGSNGLGARAPGGTHGPPPPHTRRTAVRDAGEEAEVATAAECSVFCPAMCAGQPNRCVSGSRGGFSILRALTRMFKARTPPGTCVSGSSVATSPRSNLTDGSPSPTSSRVILETGRSALGSGSNVGRGEAPALVATRQFSYLLGELVNLRRVAVTCCLPPPGVEEELHEGLKVGYEELASGLRQLLDLQRLYLRSDTPAISETGAEVLYRAVQSAPLHEGVCLDQPTL